MRLVSSALALLALALVTMSSDAGGKKKDDGSIEIYKNDAGKWRYRIKGADGKTIAMPLPQATWETKKAVVQAIDDLKDLLNTAKPVEVKDEPRKEGTKEGAGGKEGGTKEGTKKESK